VAGNSGCLHAVMSWSRSCIICFLDFRLLKEYMHFNACEKTFLNSTKRLGFNYQEDKKKSVYFQSFSSYLFVLLLYSTFLQRELSEREDFLKAICHSSSLSPIFTRFITCHLSPSVLAFHNKRRCCIIISIIHSADRAVLGDWLTVEWGGNEYS